MEPHYLYGLEKERPYTLTETIPADGYLLANSIVFKLVQDYKVYVLAADGEWQEMDENMVVMYDEHIPTPTPDGVIPITGDDTPVMLYVWLALAALAAMIVLLIVHYRITKKEKREEQPK